MLDVTRRYSESLVRVSPVRVLEMTLVAAVIVMAVVAVAMSVIVMMMMVVVVAAAMMAAAGGGGAGHIYELFCTIFTTFYNAYNVSCDG